MSIVQGSIAAQERLRWLTEQLANDGSVTIAAAAEALEVSDMTIRRDLLELEQRGAIRRVRGGATAIGPQRLAARRQKAARAKARIAAKLSELVPHHGAVAFDASSTVLRLAGSLRDARDLEVLTNGPDTFNVLQGTPGVMPLLTGGRLEPRTGSLVGPLACRTATQFRVTTFFASAAAVRPDAGGLETTLDEAEVKHGIAAGADQVVLAVDASKLGGSAVAVALEWERVDLLVTELDPSDRRLDPYRDVATLL